MPGVTVWSRVQVTGFHHWPNATEERAYLSARHRHMFVIRAEVAVDHGDRDVEFHDLGDLIRRTWGPEPRELGAMSCEAIAEEIGVLLANVAGMRVRSVQVSEDGENGATVRWDVE